MSKEVFCALFAAWFDVSGLTLEEVAGHFSTAPGTVSRWRAGHSAPAPPARSNVIAFVRQAAVKIAEALYAALEAYVACRIQDCDHDEDCPKRYCDDNECEKCCDCGIIKAIAARRLAKAALSKARGEKPWQAPSSPIYCSHANEAPYGECRCPADCACRPRMCPPVEPQK